MPPLIVPVFTQPRIVPLSLMPTMPPTRPMVPMSSLGAMVRRVPSFRQFSMVPLLEPAIPPALIWTPPKAVSYTHLHLRVCRSFPSDAHAPHVWPLFAAVTVSPHTAHTTAVVQSPSSAAPLCRQA